MRIVIVEDEIKIREGMGRLIESQTEHIVLGKAVDGEEGLEMIQRFNPDLVITDVRMPKMDGLEMIKKLYDRKISTHIIILSGYSEFEYAKKAISYGVDDYLVKPLAADDVQKMLEKVEEAIQKEKLTNGAPELYLRNLFFGEEKNIDNNCRALESICGFSEEWNYELFAGYIGSAAPSYREELENFIEELKERYSKNKMLYIYVDNQQKSYLLIQENDKALGFEKIERSFHNRMIAGYQNRAEKAIWVKQQISGLKELRGAAHVVESLISQSLVLNAEGWITKEKAQQYLPLPFLHPSEIYTQIRNRICKSDFDGLKSSSEKFLRYLKEGQFRAEEIRGAFVKSYYLISDTLQDIDKTAYQHLQNASLLRNIETAVTWNELENAYRDVIQVISGARVQREDISNYVIKKAINYIREHYQEGITQEEVSRKLEITPEYLSTLFNREMGINFSVFLKQFRISHAKRLLKGTDMKIYEVAKAAGYGDPKYFQRVFKEEVGISPGEYRLMS